MRGVLVGVVLFAVLALPSAVSADVWVGKSRSVARGVVETNADGTIKIVKVRYVIDCRRRGFEFGGGVEWVTTAENPIEHQGPTFSDSGTREQDLGRGYKATTTLTLAGRFLAGGRVRVRQTVDATVTRRGRQFDTCKGTVRFTGRKRR